MEYEFFALKLDPSNLDASNEQKLVAHILPSHILTFDFVVFL